MSTTLLPAPPSNAASSLTRALEQNKRDLTPTPPARARHNGAFGISRSPSRTRSLSEAPKPTLSPSPAFREPIKASKDDLAVASPVTPKRPSFHSRGLSLQMPQRDIEDLGASGSVMARVPLSPRLDPSLSYGSPASMLPRRSRGLDYTRACTNLHHSTLAESSPDASPTIGGRGIQIPQRKSLGNTVLDSPSNMSGGWSTMPNTERPALSSSVSSVNMLDSDNDSSSSSEDDVMDRDNEDVILSTPQVSKLSNNFITGLASSPGGEWMGIQNSPAAASLMSFQRARLRKGRSRHSSSSVSVNSSKPSPGPLSPPLMKSIETMNGGYFSQSLTRHQVQSRRESLSLGTDHLHLSDSEDGEGRGAGNAAYQSSSSGTPAEGPRGVIRRAVTRRGNLLVSSASAKVWPLSAKELQPKTKTFARIRAALLEEAAPIDSEVRREAEVIHQVRENDPTIPLTTSPILYNSAITGENALESPPEEDLTTEEKSAGNTTGRFSESFSRHAEKHSAGLGFWHNFDDRYQTPPPPLVQRDSSYGMSDENMETPPSSIGTGIASGALKNSEGPGSRSSTPMPSYAAPTAADVVRKVNNKRRRDDGFDPASFKRRAVSPGMSVQSSPVLPQSPIFSSEKSWGHPPPKASGHGHTDRSNSGGSVNGTKRVGLQGMVETNDSLMNMSID